MAAFLARLFFKDKKSRYCHQPGVVLAGVVIVVVVVIVVMKVNNLGHNIFTIQANLMKLDTLVLLTIEGLHSDLGP